MIDANEHISLNLLNPSLGRIKICFFLIFVCLTLILAIAIETSSFCIINNNRLAPILARAVLWPVTYHAGGEELNLKLF